MCLHCGKQCKNLFQRTYHDRTHTGERSFSCPQCPAKFTNRTNRAIHVRAHFKYKNYLIFVTYLLLAEHLTTELKIVSIKIINKQTIQQSIAVQGNSEHKHENIDPLDLIETDTCTEKPCQQSEFRVGRPHCRLSNIKIRKYQ